MSSVQPPPSVVMSHTAWKVVSVGWISYTPSPSDGFASRIALHEVGGESHTPESQVHPASQSESCAHVPQAPCRQAFPPPHCTPFVHEPHAPATQTCPLAHWPFPEHAPHVAH